MTLFYMWLDAKAKDKMKQFENQIIMLKQQNQMITHLGEDYKSRCEKAVEYINKHPVDACHNLLNILQIKEIKEENK